MPRRWHSLERQVHAPGESKNMTDTQLAFKVGEEFNKKITSAFWQSFKGEYGRVQASVLVYLYDNGEGQASEIADALNIPKQHASKIVKEFVLDGMVEVHQSAKDRRANSLSLTEKGKACVESHVQESDAAFEQLMGKLTQDQKGQFRLAMESLHKLLSLM